MSEVARDRCLRIEVHSTCILSMSRGKRSLSLFLLFSFRSPNKYGISRLCVCLLVYVDPRLSVVCMSACRPLFVEVLVHSVDKCFKFLFLLDEVLWYLNIYAIQYCVLYVDVAIGMSYFSLSYSIALFFFSTSTNKRT